MSTNAAAHNNRATALFVSYGLTVLLVAAATAIRWGLGYSFGPMSPFLTFYPALMISALIWGLGPGLAATGLGALAADYSFIPPIGSLGITNLPDGIALAIFCFIGVFISVITDRLRQARAEQIKRESEQRWATTLASIGDAVIATDVSGRITFMNPVAEDLTGWTFGDASMKPVGEIFNIVNEQTRREVESPVTKVLREGIVVGLANHTILVKKNGTEVPIDDSGAPVTDEDGTTTGVVLVFRDITERKKAEKQIADSKYLQQLLLDHFPGVVLLLRTTTRQVVASNQAGIDVGAVPGSTCFGTWSQRLDPCPWCLAQDLWATGKEQQVIIDTGEKVFEAYWVPVSDDLYMHYSFDVTERFRAEEKLREKEQIIQQALGISNSFTFDWDVATDRVLRSESCRKIFGIDYDGMCDATSEHFSQHVHPDDLSRFEKVLRSLTRVSDTYVMDYRLMRSDGSVVILEETAQAFFDDAGRMKRVIGVATDATARKRAEEALRESEQRWAATLSSIGDAVIATDVSGRITFMNPVAEDLTGWTFGDASMKPVGQIFNIVNEQTRREVESPVTKVLREGMVVGLANHTILVKKDGTEVPIDDSGAPIRDNDGTTTGVVLVFRDITERKRAEEALRLSEEKFAVSFANNAAGIAITRLEDGLFLEVNDTWVALNGYSREEVIGRYARTMHIWPTTEASTRFVQALQEKGSLRGWEQEFLKKSGEVFVAQLSAQILTLRGEKVILSTLVDITDRKRAEEALRISEEHYRSLFDNMLNGYAYCKMIFDANRPKDFTYLDVNAAFESLTGLRNVTGKNVSEVIPGIRQSDPELFEIYGRVAATGTPERFETYVEALGMWFSVSVYSPQEEYFVAVFDVITERKRAEEALRRSHDELEQRVLERTEALRRQADLLELAYNAIIVRDLSSRVTFWNAGAEEIYGFTRDEALGQVTHRLLQTRFPVPFEEHVAALTTMGRWEGELSHTTKDGRQIAVLSRQALQRNEAGHPVAIIEINLDMTEQRRMEAHLRQAQKMEALGTLSGGIAHDFNNMLSAIIGFTDLLSGHAATGSRDERHLKRIMEASMRGRELVKQMLLFSRKSDEEKKPIRLSSIVRESVKLLRASTPSSITIKVDVASESGFILADPVQIQQILMNLCTNAAHAMREKGGTLDITLDDFSIAPSAGNGVDIEPGSYMRLVVRDTGAGIPKAIIDRVFDPFFTTKKPGEGTGLGLSVVHGIVTQSKGYITAESEVDAGSTFTVYFRKTADEPSAVAASEQAIPTGSERILFVDDEEALVEMGEEILAGLGYEVTSRTSSREALGLLKEDPSRFDLVITDVTMPDMTGLELAGEVLALKPDMPIIMCTGFSHLVDADKATAAGIRAFLMKPLTKKEIAKTIRDVLDR